MCDLTTYPYMLIVINACYCDYCHCAQYYCDDTSFDMRSCLGVFFHICVLLNLLFVQLIIKRLGTVGRV